MHQYFCREVEYFSIKRRFRASVESKAVFVGGGGGTLGVGFFSRNCFFFHKRVLNLVFPRTERDEIRTLKTIRFYGLSPQVWARRTQSMTAGECVFWAGDECFYINPTASSDWSIGRFVCVCEGWVGNRECIGCDKTPGGGGKGKKKRYRSRNNKRKPVDRPVSRTV